MITVTCDRCGKKIDTNDLPPYRQPTFPGMGAAQTQSKNNFFKAYAVDAVLVTEAGEGKTLDLCPVCRDAIYDFIFEYKDTIHKAGDDSCNA